MEAVMLPFEGLRASLRCWQGTHKGISPQITEDAEKKPKFSSPFSSAVTPSKMNTNCQY